MRLLGVIAFVGTVIVVVALVDRSRETATERESLRTFVRPAPSRHVTSGGSGRSAPEPPPPPPATLEPVSGPAADPRPPNAIAFWDGQRGLAGTGRTFEPNGGAIWLTEDAGSTFQRVARASSGVAWVETAGDDIAWAVVQARRRQAMFRSDDGGHSWRRMPTDTLFAPSFATPEVGIAIRDEWPSYGGGALGSTNFVRTTDGGASWSPVASPCPKHDGAVATIDSATDVWAVCTIVVGGGIEGKELFRSRDFGQTWEEIVHHGGCQRGGLCAGGFTQGITFSGDHGIVLADDAAFTTDGGMSWRRGSVGRGRHSLGVVAVHQRTPTDIVAISGGSGLSRLMVSGDGGHSWEERHRWPWRLAGR